ncbi:hypothetical protein [Comamonas sp. NLF-1-9]|uniref:hypothetical protein n=1 Tax=Comamonas sp. NLF-1-9 TaxID=2853163 RepID=UPI001C4546D5|nr:hypothetical protein [Comamonas sp. NLF-1-9]QXL84165.1 hypothetical protein KUD94_13190 [Comamonas sp. NLF-1-9]
MRLRANSLTRKSFGTAKSATNTRPNIAESNVAFFVPSRVNRKWRENNLTIALMYFSQRRY